MNFLLVHGAFHGGWCFDPLIAALSAQGHVAVAPDLPGNGPGEAGGWHRSQAGCAQAVVEVARGMAGPVHLVGHSMGGVTVSNAAEMAPELFASLTYLSAFLLPNGRSPFQTTAKWPEDAVKASVKPQILRGNVRMPADRACAIFYNACPEDVAQASAARLVPQAVRTILGKVRVSPERWGAIPRHYVFCTQDKTISHDRQKQLVAAVGGLRGSETLDCDHSPFLSRTGDCADALLRLTQGL